VNFLTLKPENLEGASYALREELDANKRAWERTLWVLDYVKKNYPNDQKLIEALDTIRHHLARRA
jgi:hypothetical protein